MHSEQTSFARWNHRNFSQAKGFASDGDATQTFTRCAVPKKLGAVSKRVLEPWRRMDVGIMLSRSDPLSYSVPRFLCPPHQQAQTSRLKIRKHRVVARAAVDQVCAILPDDGVVPGLAVKFVVALSAEQQVVVIAAVEMIDARAAIELVVARAAVDCVVARLAEKVVGVVAAGKAIVSGSAKQCIVSRMRR